MRALEIAGLRPMRLTTGDNWQAVSAPRSPALAGGLVIGALLLVFVLDRATDSAPVQHLYYLPIILAAFRFGMRGSVVAALAAIGLYHLANPHLLTFQYAEPDLVQIALFLAVGTVVAKLRSDARRLRHLAMTDDLTGLHNLRSFEVRLQMLMRAAAVMETPLALLVLDVDRLKSLNDEFGHLAGAEAVRTVGHVIGRRIPPGAVACRYGGDEFAVAIPRCPAAEAHRIASDLCRAVRESAPVLAGHAFAAGTLTISVGASCSSFDRRPPPRTADGRDAEAGEILFRAADAALYQAKARGRNQVCVT